MRTEAEDNHPEKTKHLLTGEWGEEVAVELLKQKKYRIKGQRVRLGPKDEIDIIAIDGKELVFIEVKTRKNEAFGSPAESVDRKKRMVLSRAAVRYIKKLKNPAVYFRFDVIEVVGETGDRAPVVRHIENAFVLDKRYTLPC